MTFLLYGATGYTGKLIAEHAAAIGLKPILAGRNPDKLRPLAEKLGLEFRTFDLKSPSAIDAGLRGASAVLLAAGPFSATSQPVVDACLRNGAHYLDITGEIAVFEALAARDQEAKRANVALLPGAGFDVVPSDCLAVHVKRRLPEAKRLRLAIGGLNEMSRGTARTMIEALKFGTLVRRDGSLIDLPRIPQATIDFGTGPKPAIGFSWGDIATAWVSTNVGNLDVYFAVPPALARLTSWSRPFRALGATAPGQWLLKKLVGTFLREGPSPEQRERSRCVIVADAWDQAGKQVTSRLHLKNAYSLTAHTAVELARRAAAGEIRSGFQTPATACGPDFVLQFEGVRREDLPGI